MGLNFGCKEQCSKLLQSTKYLSLVNLSVNKSSQRLQENALPWQWHVWGGPLNRKWFGGKLVFRPRTGQNAPVSPFGIIIVKFAQAIARIWNE
jgi:hypothetical protein